MVQRYRKDAVPAAGQPIAPRKESRRSGLAATDSADGHAIITHLMMTTTTPQATNLKLNFNNKDYEFSDLPRTAQLLLQDMMQMDQQISKLQFELRHLQAARQVYGSSLRKTMAEEEAEHPSEGMDGHHGHHNHDD
jgi:hypothetical protein